MKSLLPAVVPALTLAVFTGPAPAQPADAPADAKGIAFFEQKIRPVLAQHCYRCHSEEAQKNKKLKGQLLLDSRAGLLRGGESGPALVPGKSKDSRLLKALRYDGIEMPPDGKLPAEVAADFAKWIDMGAPDPREGKAVLAKRAIDLEAGRQFWSLGPLRKAAPPAVKNRAWVRTPLDRFILAKLEEQGLTPNGPTDRARLIRRAYYDLAGLPPAPAEVEAFVAAADGTDRTDGSGGGSYERLIDRLLDSPQYGERWARHWLDVVRFAESGGYEFDGDRPGAYHYRDFVIRALNQDMPHDQFVRWQLAGDKLVPGDYLAGAATGFLVAGPYPGQTTSKTIERIRYDQLDDMVATMGSAMLGLTLGCVRCHEHKYDPIPQQDYYRLIAALGRTASTDLKLDPNPEVYRKAKARFDVDHAALVKKLTHYEKDAFPAVLAKWRQMERPKLPDAPWWIVDPVSVKAKTTLARQPDGSFLATGKDEKNDTHTLVAHTLEKGITAIRLEALADKSLPGGGPGLNKDGSFQLTQIQLTAGPLDPKNQAKPVNVKLKPAAATFEQPGHPLAAALLGDKSPGWSIAGQTGKDHAAIFDIDGSVGFDGGTVLTVTLKFEGSGHGIGRLRLAFTTAPRPAKLDAPALLQNYREIDALLAADKGDVTERNRPALARWFRRFDPEADRLLSAVDASARGEPKPNLASVFAAGPGGGDVFFLVRGEVDRKQAKAVPGFLQVLTTAAQTDERWLGKDVEPRVGLGNWLTDAEHGAGRLLARVIVNRLWKHHFGKGIVATTNDFGAQGDRPTHPELLDYLAGELIRSGWRLKPIHKLIMTSAAYLQGNEVSAANLAADPGNRLLGRRAAQRLEGETIRDALLAVSGQLDPKMYGAGTLDENSPRRSVYLTVKRSQLIPFLQTFDFPEPIQSIGDRSNTTVPTQALALMNSPFVRKAAEQLAQRVRGASGESPEAAIGRAYLATLSRPPTAAERQRMTAFVQQQAQALGSTPQAHERALVEMCQALLCLNEFIYVD
jgi:hypothetical protein